MIRRATILIGALLTAAVCSVAASPASRDALFDYDKAAPLGVAFGTSKSLQGIVRQELSYQATATLRLQALFVHPASGGPWPLVIWSPGAGGDRRQQLPEAIDLAGNGAASLLIDEAPLGNCNNDAEKEVDLQVSYVVSRRRAVDLAEKLPNVDTKRIAASGFSRGATVTAALAGVEHRIHTFVLKSGRGHLAGYVRFFCTALSPAQLEARVAVLGVVDPVRWIRKATVARVLIQNGTQDELSPRADVLALYAAARKPKELRWYPAGHDLNAEATAYREQWLLRQLRV